METKESPPNSLNRLFSFKYNAVMSTERNKFSCYLEHLWVGVADVSPSHYGQTKYGQHGAK